MTGTLAGVIATAMLGLAVHPAAAQVTREWGAQVTGASGRPAYLGGGVAWGWRPGLRDRLLLHGGLGAAEHQAALRVEAAWHFLLSPKTEKGLTAYVGGGIAGQFAQSSRAWLLIIAGVEQNPAGKSGWMVELGVGGGVRMAVGFRWRK